MNIRATRLTELSFKMVEAEETTKSGHHPGGQSAKEKPQVCERSSQLAPAVVVDGNRDHHAPSRWATGYLISQVRRHRGQAGRSTSAPSCARTDILADRRVSSQQSCFQMLFWR